MILMEVGDRHVIHVRLAGADALYVARDPFARMELRAWEDRHTNAPHVHGGISRAVQQHRGAVRKDEELGLANPRVDEVYLELPLPPPRQDACRRLRAVTGGLRAGQQRRHGGETERTAHKTSA